MGRLISGLLALMKTGWTADWREVFNKSIAGKGRVELERGE